MIKPLMWSEKCNKISMTIEKPPKADFRGLYNIDQYFNLLTGETFLIIGLGMLHPLDGLQGFRAGE
jgi:hypothetical protein